MMKPIPDSVRDHINNAEYYLTAAGKLPSPTQDAAHILLLLIGWENITIADEELNAWATGEDVDKKIYKDHARKFKNAPEVLRVIVGSSGTPAKEVRFQTGRDFEELRLACQYGSNTESKDVAKIFSRGWHADGLERELGNKIKWLRTILGAYKDAGYDFSP